MMPSIHRAEAKFKAATDRAERLATAAAVARDQARLAGYALGDARAGKAVPHNRDMTSEALRERIADYARSHGAECALGRKVSEASWRPFRAALDELARRADARDR